MESIEQTFNGAADFGKKVTCTISRNGDLIHRVYLRVELPDVKVKPSSAFRWLNWVGHILVKSVEIEIGGQRIDKHYGDWLHIWNELTQTAGHQLGYANMVGNIPALVNPQENTGTNDKLVSGEILYIPLEFWFCRNPGLALPLIAYILGQKSALPSPKCVQGWQNMLVGHAKKFNNPQALVRLLCNRATRSNCWKPLRAEKEKSLLFIKNKSLQQHDEAMSKVCSRCNTERPLTEFGKSSSTKDGYRYDCKRCRTEYNQRTKEQKAEYNKTYYGAKREAILKQNAAYRERHTEDIGQQRKEYRSREHIREHIKQKNRDYLETKKARIKERRKTDKHFQLSEILRSKVHKMLRGQHTSYGDYIGCDIQTLRSWLEFNFDDNMNWDNLGMYWQVDHILPISLFNFDRELDKCVCFRWTNLQPLEKTLNREKSNKLELHYFYNSIVSIHRFINNKQAADISGYQNIRESLCWLREKLRYGENPSDWAISSQDAKSDSDKDMRKVQRLDGFGSERFSQPP